MKWELRPSDFMTQQSPENLMTQANAEDFFILIEPGLDERINALIVIRMPRPRTKNQKITQMILCELAPMNNFDLQAHLCEFLNQVVAEAVFEIQEERSLHRVTPK